MVALLIYFRSIIGPLLLAVILAYVLHPVAAKLSTFARLNWRWSVNIVFLLFVLILLAILTVSGFAIIQQMESLVGVITTFTVTLPEFIDRISSQVYIVGPYQFGLNQTDLQTFTNQFIDILQPMLGQFGSIIELLCGQCTRHSRLDYVRARYRILPACPDWAGHRRDDLI